MLMRSTGPSGLHGMTLRSPLIAIGAIRLRVPPQDAPMEKTLSALSAASSWASATGLSTMLNTPEDRPMSRFQNSWPGQDGSAGCSTLSTAPNCVSRLAKSSETFPIWATRKPMVSMPRRASWHSSGETPMPKPRRISFIFWRRPRSATVTEPSSRSEWPPTYLVSASQAKSAPCASGLKISGVAQVLSQPTSTPFALAAAMIAGASCTSMVPEPGDSTQTSFVAASINPAMPAPISGS